jgi:hypothetical protein
LGILGLDDVEHCFERFGAARGCRHEPLFHLGPSLFPIYLRPRDQFGTIFTDAQFALLPLCGRPVALGMHLPRDALRGAAD